MNDFQKILSKLLQGKKLKQPFTYDPRNESYRDDLAVRFESYVDRISKLTGDSGEVSLYLQDNKEDIQELCSNILKVIDSYLSGSAGKAYDHIETVFNMRLVQDNIRYLIHDMNKFHRHESLFRVRLSEQQISKRSDMFHIPFQLRNLVATQRYSIAGLPSLYLGTSIYGCWQEMGKPDLNKLYLSRYEMSNEQNAQNLKCLNLAYSLETLKHIGLESLWGDDEDSMNTDVKLNISYLVFFPILMACSYNRAYETASFHVEYIFPNLLLQWISKEKSQVSGISYLSTKTKQLRHHPIGVNFVFPPEIDKVLAKGFCPDLEEKFHLSKPVSWQLLDTINGQGKENESNFSITDDLEESFVKNYKKTKFSQMEVKLKSIMKTAKAST